METVLLCIDDLDNSKKDLDKLQQASSIIKRGGLVACPTETVYGLCANALDPNAVANTFVAKGRPNDNPLIVHISDLAMLETLVSCIPETAQRLINKFWGGPLTIIFNKSEIVPYSVTAGLETVAVRMPSNKIMQKLIELSGTPISAPSANLSGSPSPTSAKYVQKDLDGKIECIIDGGVCEFGVESTIVDCTTEKVMLLRPGNITVEMLEEVVGDVVLDSGVALKPKSNIVAKAPGMKYKHYSPKANVVLFNDYKNLYKEIESNNKNDFGLLYTYENTQLAEPFDNKLCLGERSELTTVTKNLFEMLREMDEKGVSTIYCEMFSLENEGLAIMNRLNKASDYTYLD